MSARNNVLWITLIMLAVLLGPNLISCAEEATEEPPPPGPGSVPAAPNDSIVTGKVIDVQSPRGDIPWEITIEVQSSEDVPGYANGTRQKIGQQISVRTEEDAAGLEVGQVITAHVRLEGDERTRFYHARDIR